MPYVIQYAANKMIFNPRLNLRLVSGFLRMQLKRKGLPTIAVNNLIGCLI